MSATHLSANDRGDLAANARKLNDSIAKGAEALGDEQAPYDFFCECGDSGCRETVRLTAAGYYAARPGPVLAHAPATGRPSDPKERSERRLRLRSA